MRAYYFGCARGVWGHRDVGHYFYLPGGRRPWSVNREQPETFLPWGHVDAQLAPRRHHYSSEVVFGERSTRAEELPNGIAALHQKDGWTALSFWDNTGDSRGNSNSNFLFDATLDFDQALAAASEHFPELFERFDFEIVPVERGASG